ncbi:MAG: calcium/sodium antiporter [Clostridium sp.]
MSYILLIVGFILLIKGADIFVDGASTVAKKFGIPSVIVGLTIVSLGTSAPELAVSLISSFQGSNEIAVGNVLGSNMFNTLVVLGATAVVTPLVIKKNLIKRDFLINVVVTVLLFFFISASGGKDGFLSRGEGLVLLALCIAYTIFLIISARNTEVELAAEEEEALKNFKPLANTILIIVGAAGIVIGGKIVVDAATNIALSIGMSEKLVGLTIVAVGTSLPELVTSLVAAKKGETEIALGNVLGSNIFNILLILGASSSIMPITVAANLGIDVLFLIAISVIIGVMVFINKKEDIKKLNRIEGFTLIALYVGYLAYIVMRG